MMEWAVSSATAVRPSITQLHAARHHLHAQLDVRLAPTPIDKDIHWHSCSSGCFAAKMIPRPVACPATPAILLYPGQYVTLEPIMGTGEAKNKKSAEEAAAKQIYDKLVEEGWYDPSVAPSTSHKKEGVVSSWCCWWSWWCATKH